MPLRATLRGYWQEVADVASAIDVARLEDAAITLLACQARGHAVFVVGNGGSAATASHFACDLAKGTRGDGPPTFHVVALTDNVALLTAWANDSGYERVFAEQLASLARPGDVLVAISASGTSPNVVAAVEAARSCEVGSIALTGRDGGLLGQMADTVVRVPSDRKEVVEDAHLIVAHSLCVAVRERLAECAPSGSTPQFSSVSELNC
ncbi:MAG: SIS domain-containing protein [Chloroflexia bacterium]|nr:SIS domain-containing protein [Chloroflexia bacterium]